MNTRLANAAAVTVMLCSIAATAEYVRRGYAQPVAGTPHVARFVGPVQSPQHQVFRNGTEQALVTIVEFADFQCPGCRGVQPILDSIVARSMGKLAVLQRHYPLTGIHPFARQAAIAAECAGRQGRYPEFQRVLYAAQDSIGILEFGEVARRAGVTDSAMFTNCQADSTVARGVDEDVAEAARLDLAGTPSFVIGDSVYMGLTSAALDSTIRAHARARGISWP